MGHDAGKKPIIISRLEFSKDERKKANLQHADYYVPGKTKSKHRTQYIEIAAADVVELAKLHELQHVKDYGKMLKERIDSFVTEAEEAWKTAKGLYKTKGIMSGIWRCIQDPEKRKPTEPTGLDQHKKNLKQTLDKTVKPAIQKRVKALTEEFLKVGHWQATVNEIEGNAYRAMWKEFKEKGYTPEEYKKK